MKIVICGGGKVGEVICEELSTGNNDIILIEKNAAKLEKLINKYDITGLVGNGASYEIQQEADVANADMFIAVTELDEVNIIAAVLAKRLGAENTVARVRNPEYSTQIQFVKESLGISMLINPEFSAARDIFRVLKFTSALSVEQFSASRVSLVEVEVTAESPLVNLSLKDFRSRFGSVLVCIIQRGNEIIIPSGEQFIREGDRIHITGASKDTGRFMKIITNGEKSIRSILIVGGGRITYYLLKHLLQTKIEVTVVEVNPERCQFLAQEFPNVRVIQADGTDQEVLDEQLLDHFDAFISLTGVDEENLIMSVYAKKQGVKKVITKISRTSILRILEALPLRTIITPKRIVADETIRFVRGRMNSQGSNVEALYRLVDNNVEALQFRVKRGSKVCDVPLSKLRIKNSLLIAYIVRGEELLFPTGDDSLQAHDRVIIITTEKQLNDLDDILVK